MIEGQAGLDTMLFNGANVAEVIDLSANGGRLRFFRNIANVVMDANDVERGRTPRRIEETEARDWLAMARGVVTRAATLPDAASRGGTVIRFLERYREVHPYGSP